MENEKYYIVECRYNPSESVPYCYMSNDLEKVMIWLSNNDDFDINRYFYWAILQIIPDDESGAEIYKYFDIMLNELYGQPMC